MRGVLSAEMSRTISMFNNLKISILSSSLTELKLTSFTDIFVMYI